MFNKYRWFMLLIALLSNVIVSCTSLFEGTNNNQQNNNPTPIIVGPHLIPGTGFTGPTQEPARIGLGNAKVIARWDVVPYQTINSPTFNVGIVAFHIAGIDRIEISLNGGPFTAVNTMALNNQPGVNVVEYYATIYRNDFTQDGPIELRAIAYPKTQAPQEEGTGNYPGGGDPRLLDPLFLYVDAGELRLPKVAYVSPNGNDGNNGTEGSPVRTPFRAAQIITQASGGNADGGIIYLDAGDYTLSRGSGALPTVTNRWLTIRPKTNASRNQVVVRGPYPGSGFPGLHLEEVTIRQDVTGAEMSNDRLWVNNSTFQCNGIFTYCYGYQGWTGDWDRLYVTNIEVYDSAAGVPAYADLLRNASADHVQSGIRFEKIAINVHYKTMYPEPGGHTDFLDYHWNLGVVTDNSIAYGIIGESIEAAGIVLADTVGLINTALVNIAINLVSVNYSWWGGGTDHLRHFLMYNVTHRGSFSWDIPQAQMENVSVRGSVFTSMGSSAGAVSPGGFDQNHFVNTNGIGQTTFGTNFTTGDPLFTDTFIPQTNSPLLWNKRQTLVNDQPAALVPVDVNNEAWLQPTLGAMNGLQD